MRKELQEASEKLNRAREASARAFDAFVAANNELNKARDEYVTVAERFFYVDHTTVSQEGASS